MTSLPIRGLGRRQLAVVMAALLAFAGFAMWRTTQSANAAAATVPTTLTCGLAGEITVTYTVDSTPATPVAGKPFTLNTSSSMSAPKPDLANIGVGSMVINIPVPADITPGEIMAMGGNLTKQSQATANGVTALTLKANAGVTLGTLQVPSLMINTTINAGTEGKSIRFDGPSSISVVTTVDLGQGPIADTCNAAATNPPLLTVTVAPAATTTTAAPTTTTTRATTTTAAPTTTTTRATTTTAAPTTTTTRATTTSSTTTATTTPRPTTTRVDRDHDGDGGFWRFFFAIICKLFHLCGR